MPINFSAIGVLQSGTPRGYLHRKASQIDVLHNLTSQQLPPNKIEFGTYRSLGIAASFAQWARTYVPTVPTKGLPMHILKRFLNDDAGATAIEYGLIAALVAVVIITGITAVGTKLSTTLTNVSTSLR